MISELIGSLWSLDKSFFQDSNESEVHFRDCSHLFIKRILSDFIPFYSLCTTVKEPIRFVNAMEFYLEYKKSSQ